MRLKELWAEWLYLGGRRTWNRLSTAIWNTYFGTWITTADTHLGSNEIWCQHLRWAWKKPSITSCPNYDPDMPVIHGHERKIVR